MTNFEKSAVYTRGGDRGETSLFGGSRVKKSSPRIATIGAVDKLNAALGLANVQLKGGEKKLIVQIQSELFSIGAILANPKSLANTKDKELTISEDSVVNLEKKIDEYDSQVPKLRNFILPGGNESAAQLHFARTLAREAERELTKLAEKEAVAPVLKKYLNRLSDLLFVLARFVNYRGGEKETIWQGK